MSYENMNLDLDIPHIIDIHKDMIIDCTDIYSSKSDSLHTDDGEEIIYVMADVIKDRRSTPSMIVVEAESVDNVVVVANDPILDTRIKTVFESIYDFWIKIVEICHCIMRCVCCPCICCADCMCTLCELNEGGVIALLVVFVIAGCIAVGIIFSGPQSMKHTMWPTMMPTNSTFSPAMQ